MPPPTPQKTTGYCHSSGCLPELEGKPLPLKRLLLLLQAIEKSVSNRLGNVPLVASFHSDGSTARLW